MLRQAENLGLYIPTFFFIQINTDESLIDIEKCTQHTQSTFAHEYIHFLQDLLTLFGLRNINYIVNVVYTISLESQKQTPLKYPIKITDQKIRTQIDLFTLYYGTKFLSKDIFLITGYKIEPNSTIENYQYVECVEVFIISLGVGQDAFYFGAFSILESVAYILEKSIFGSTAVPNFPYNVVDLIIDSLFSELNLTQELKLAICEESLNSGHPGLTFFRILETIKKENLKFINPDDFHTFCHLHFFLQDENKVKFSISFALESETNKSQSNLKGYFPKQEIIKINPWFDYIFNNIKELRKQKIHFHKIYKNKDYLIKIINRLGTPLIANNINYYFKNPEISNSDCDISILLAIRELMMISLGEQINCGLKSNCERTKPSLVNINCDTAPHENRKNKEKCDLTALLYLWGIE